jgi:hypothetical protein
MTDSKREYEELIERLEKATGPDREADVAIWLSQHPDRDRLWALTGIQDRLRTDRLLVSTVLRTPTEYGFWEEKHNYTRSIDAAMTLVHEDAFVQIKRFPDDDDRYEFRGTAWITLGEDKQWNGRGSSPAIALCIAALRARSQ